MEIAKVELEDILYNADIDAEEDVNWNYSGRCMYGAKCFGFTGTLHTFGSFIAHAAEADIDWATGFADSATTDSLGWDTIFYFPGVTIVEDDEE